MSRREAKRRRREGKPCILCGGTRPSDTTEHAPPTAMFHDAQRPQGYMFPACQRCNNGSGLYDALASFVFMSGRPEALLRTAEFTEHQKKLARTIARNLPPLYTTATDIDLETPSGLIIGRSKRLELTPDTSKGLATFAAKQCYAYWCEETGQPLAEAATVGIRIITNHNEDHDLDNEIARFLGAGRSMRQAKRYVDDQFFYRYQRSEDDKLALIQAVYHQNAGFFAVIDELSEHPRLISAMPHQFKTSSNKGIHRTYPKERSKLLYSAQRG